MSKIGRIPIDLGNVQVEVDGQIVKYKGTKASGEHILPDELEAKVEGKTLKIIGKISDSFSSKQLRNVNRIWGLNRALLSNKIAGSEKEFSQNVQIVGLGYKAAKSGKNLVFSLGFSHKIDFDLPETVTVDIDKSGQKLIVKSSNKFLVGQVCSEIKDLRPPEPYKGTGIKLADEVIRRKAGKSAKT